MTVVSFWTGTWRYRECAERLMAQCDGLGIPHRITERPDKGWLMNTRQKPRHILESLDAVGPVLWIDADGGLYGQPHALDPSADLMAVARTERPFWAWWKWHVGVLFVNDTAPARAFVTAWMEACEDPAVRGGDDSIFQGVWRTGWPGVRMEPLPPTYHAIGQPGPADVAGIGLSRAPEKLAYHNNPRRG